MAVTGAVLIFLENSGRCTLVTMEFGGPAGSAHCGPGRHCAPAPPKAIRARPQPRLLSPCAHGAVIHRCVPEPGPGEPQGAGAAVCRHPEPPRRVRHVLGALNCADKESGASAREMTDVLVELYIGVRAGDVDAGAFAGLCRRVLLHLGSANSHCRKEKERT